MQRGASLSTSRRSILLIPAVLALVLVAYQLGRGRRMDLVGLSLWVDKVFRMTRMDSVFRIYKTLEEAPQETADAP